MRQFHLAPVVLGLTFLTVCGSGGCAKDESNGSRSAANGNALISGRPQVYAVNYPLAFFAEQIGGEYIDVHFPVPDDLDPAFWNPNVASVTAFQQADLILLNGASYAKWIRRNSLPDSKLLNTSAEARQQYIYVDDAVTHQHGPDGEHSHGELASTTWLDFQLAGMQAESICNALAELMPDHATAFESQFVSLKTELEKLDQALLSVAEDQRALPVIGSHPVYQYLASRYALNLKSVHWEPDQMPDEAEWSKLGDMLERHPAKTMLWEAEPLPGIRSKLDGMGLQSIVFNPTGNVPRQGDFLKAMQQNVARLTEILESP
ncbi:MAG: metal ABC transporter substrate-binding protein [Planctomycetota bacterium]